ncbi:hypothetical protein [Streptomyces sp. YKOK-I1]
MRATEAAKLRAWQTNGGALTEPASEEIADGVVCRLTRPRHASVGGLWMMPTEEV